MEYEVKAVIVTKTRKGKRTTKQVKKQISANSTGEAVAKATASLAEEIPCESVKVLSVEKL